MTKKSLEFLLLDGPRLDALDVAAINARDRVAGHVLGIDHVQIAVPAGGEEDCRTFYLGVLGLREIERPKAGEGRSFLWVQAGLSQIHFRVDPEFTPARFAHPGLAVADAELFAAHLESVGWEVERGDAVKAGRIVEGKQGLYGPVAARILFGSGMVVVVSRDGAVDVADVDRVVHRLRANGTLSKLARFWLGIDPAALPVLR